MAKLAALDTGNRIKHMRTNKETAGEMDQSMKHKRVKVMGTKANMS